MSNQPETFLTKAELQEHALANMDLFMVAEDYKMQIAGSPDLLYYGSHVEVAGPELPLQWSFDDPKGSPGFFGYQVTDAFMQGVLWERARQAKLAAGK